MKRALFTIVFLCVPLFAQQLTLTARVEDERGNAISGMTIRVLGMGQDESKVGTGEVQIPLNSAVKAGQEIEISVIPSSWVIKNYYANRVVVPEAAVVHLVVVKKGSYSLLGDAQIRELLKEATQGQTLVPASGRTTLNSVIQARANDWGFAPSQVRQRIEKWTDDPKTSAFDKGLAEFYKGNYSDAAQALSVLKEQRQSQLLAAERLLGDSYYMMNRLPEAAAQYEEMLHVNARNLTAHTSILAICFQQTVFAGSDEPSSVRLFSSCANYSEEKLLQAVEEDQRSPTPDLVGEAGALIVLTTETTKPILSDHEVASLSPNVAKEFVRDDMKKKRSRMVLISKRFVNAIEMSTDPSRLVYINVGVSVWATEEYDEARGFLEQQLKKLGTSNPRIRASFLASIADMTVRNVSVDAASPILEESLQLCKSSNLPLIEATIHSQIAQRFALFSMGQKAPNPEIQSHLRSAEMIVDRLPPTSQNVGTIFEIRQAYINALIPDDPDQNFPVHDVLPLADKNVSLVEKFYGSNSLYATSARTMLITALTAAAEDSFDDDRYADAVAYYGRVVAIVDKKQDLLPVYRDGIDYDEVLENYSSALEELGRKNEAVRIRNRITADKDK